LQIKQLLSDENQRQFAAILRNANTIFTKEGPETMRKLQDTLTKADAAIENIRKISAPFADNSSDLQRNLTYTSGQLGLMIKDVRDLMKGYAGADGTVQRLLTDPTLYNRASDAV